MVRQALVPLTSHGNLNVLDYEEHSFKSTQHDRHWSIIYTAFLSVFERRSWPNLFDWLNIVCIFIFLMQYLHTTVISVWSNGRLPISRVFPENDCNLLEIIPVFAWIGSKILQREKKHIADPLKDFGLAPGKYSGAHYQCTCTSICMYTIIAGDNTFNHPIVDEKLERNGECSRCIFNQPDVPWLWWSILLNRLTSGSTEQTSVWRDIAPWQVRDLVVSRSSRPKEWSLLLFLHHMQWW